MAEEHFDYKFESAFQFAQDYEQVHVGLSHQALADRFAVYCFNMRRVVMLGHFPVIFLYWHGSISQNRGAVNERFGRDPEALRLPPNSPEQGAFQSAMTKHSDYLHTLSAEEAQQKIVSEGAFHLQRMLEVARGLNTELEDGIGATLYAMVLNSYAAFEALVTDVWREALNINSDLGQRFMSAHKDMSIKPNVFERYGLDLSHSMGSMLAEMDKANFKSLGGIIHAYKVAFGDDAGAIFTKRKRLQLGEKVRHLVAHRGGYVDERFAKDFKQITGADIGTGGYLLMDGDLVRGLIDSMVETATEIIQFVDGWLVANPKA